MMHRPLFNRLAIRLLTMDPVVALTSRSTGWATVFMMHRLACEASGHQGHSPEVLRETLAWLRRHRFEIVDIETLFRRLLGEGPPLRRTVAFTLDDGYVEQGNFAASLFGEFDAPSTTFLATGFMDRALWFWWDQIEYILARTRVRKLDLIVGTRPIRLDLSIDAEREAAQFNFTESCKLVSEAEKQEALARLAVAAEVDVPTDPPSEYQPMTWEEARSAERKGMRLGAQTVTHPILSRTEAAQSRLEVEQSWQRVVQEIERPVPVFCFPNGQPDDFGDREIAVLEELGFIGAVAGSPGNATVFSGRIAEELFHLPRFALMESLRVNVMLMGGLERVKAAVRRTIRGQSEGRGTPPLKPAGQATW